MFYFWQGTLDRHPGDHSIHNDNTDFLYSCSLYSFVEPLVSQVFHRHCVHLLQSVHSTELRHLVFYSFTLFCKFYCAYESKLFPFLKQFKSYIWSTFAQDSISYLIAKVCPKVAIFPFFSQSSFKLQNSLTWLKLESVKFLVGESGHSMLLQLQRSQMLRRCSQERRRLPKFLKFCGIGKKLEEIFLYGTYSFYMNAEKVCSASVAFLVLSPRLQ